jgi:hypothetical protein
MGASMNGTEPQGELAGGSPVDLDIEGMLNLRLDPALPPIPEVGVRIRPHLYVLDEVPFLMAKAALSFTEDEAPLEGLEPGADITDVVGDYLEKRLNPEDPEWASPYTVGRALDEMQEGVLKMAVVGMEYFDLELAPRALATLRTILQPGNIIFNRHWASAENIIHVLEHEELHRLLLPEFQQRSEIAEILIDVHVRIVEEAGGYSISLPAELQALVEGNHAPVPKNLAEGVSLMNPEIMDWPEEFWCQFVTRDFPDVPEPVKSRMRYTNLMTAKVLELCWKPEYKKAVELIASFKAKARSEAEEDLRSLREAQIARG